MSSGEATPGPSRRWIVAARAAVAPPPTRAAIPPARPAIAHDCQPGRAEKPEKQVMPRYAHLDGRREAEFARAHGPRCRARPRGGRGKERGGCWRRRTSARAPQMPERRLERGADVDAESTSARTEPCRRAPGRPTPPSVRHDVPRHPRRARGHAERAGPRQPHPPTRGAAPKPRRRHRRMRARSRGAVAVWVSQTKARREVPESTHYKLAVLKTGI